MAKLLSMTKLSLSNTTTRFGISPKSDDDTVYSHLPFSSPLVRTIKPIALKTIQAPAPVNRSPIHQLVPMPIQVEPSPRPNDEMLSIMPKSFPPKPACCIGAGFRCFLRRIPKLARRRFSGNRRRRDLKQSFNGFPDWLAYLHGRKPGISDLFEYKSSGDSKRDGLFRVPNFAELFDPWGNDYHLKPHRRNRFQQPPCQRRRHLVIASARNLRKTPSCVLPLQPYF